MLAVEQTEDACDLVEGEYDGQSPPRSRPPDLVHPRQLDPQHLAVEKQQGGERLAVDGATPRSLASQDRKASISVQPKPAGWRRP